MARANEKKMRFLFTKLISHQSDWNIEKTCLPVDLVHIKGHLNRDSPSCQALEATIPESPESAGVAGPRCLRLVSTLDKLISCKLSSCFSLL